jgi:hypothetical protein
LYSGSNSALIQAAYPEHPWILWRFNRVSKDFWCDTEQQRALFDYIALKENVKHWEDWYRVTRRQMCRHGASSVLIYYRQSPAEAVQTLYPEYPWIKWKFNRVFSGFWQERKHHRQVLDSLRAQFHIENWEQWYKVTQRQIYKSPCASLLHSQFRGSPCLMLQHVFPEYNWLPWKFNPVPDTFWEKGQNWRRYFDWIVKQHQLGGAVALAGKTIQFFRQNYCSRTLTDPDKLKMLLQLVYPGTNAEPYASSIMQAFN